MLSVDTWGISGSTFLMAFLTMAFWALVFAIVRRRLVVRGAGTTRARDVTPAEAGFVASGPSGAVLSALGALRAAGAVSAEGGRLATTGSVPAGTDEVGRAVFDAVPGRTTKEVAAHQRVRDALAEMERRLAREGLVLDADGRSRARVGGWLLLGVAALGVVRIAAELSIDRPAQMLMLATVFTALFGLYFTVGTPRRTKAGDRMLSRLREIHWNLHPRQRPAWTTYGANNAAMGVALFGAAALWAGDPAFAGDANIEHDRDGSYFGGGGSGWDGGGGSSCGGGGGDGGGGGGCGGGGGGCGGGGGG